MRRDSVRGREDLRICHQATPERFIGEGRAQQSELIFVNNVSVRIPQCHGSLHSKDNKVNAISTTKEQNTKRLQLGEQRGDGYVLSAL